MRDRKQAHRALLLLRLVSVAAAATVLVAVTHIRHTHSAALVAIPPVLAAAGAKMVALRRLKHDSWK